MSLNQVPAGKDIPEDIYVVIEIPANADPIKYEVDKDTGAVFVDRFMSTPMFYPCNYGYVNHTLSLDGDPVDVELLRKMMITSEGAVTDDIRCKVWPKLLNIDVFNKPKKKSGNISYSV